MRKGLIFLLCLWSIASFSMEEKHCTFAQTNQFLPTEQHGSQCFFQCITCRGEGLLSKVWSYFYPIEDTTSICPACITHCHVGHEVRVVDGSNKSYFCDCGANMLGNSCCLMPKKSVKQNIDPNNYFGLFRDILRARKSDSYESEKQISDSFTLSAIAIEKLTMSLTRLVTYGPPALPIDETHLTVHGYSYGFNKDRARGAGLCDKDNLADLIQQISIDTGFNFSFWAKRALVITAKSHEQFEVPFDKENTSPHRVYGANTEEKIWDMMRDHQRRDYRYIDKEPIIAAELRYKSGGKLVLLMGRTKNILDFSDDVIAQNLSDLLKQEINSFPKPLFVPKIEVKSEPLSIINILKKHVDEPTRNLLNDMDDVQIAAQLSIHEEGTDAYGVAAGISKGRKPEPLIFNRPFLALVLDQHNSVLFISHIAFD